jgi:Outer membrane protein beta-barrel domain
MKVFLAAVCGLAASAYATAAHAVEHENAIGVDVGPTIFIVQDKSSPDIGGSFGFHYTYGISDAFNFVADAGWSLVALNETLTDPTTPRTRPTNITNANAGLAYVLDVLRWVPYGSIEFGGYALNGGTIGGTQVLPGFSLAVGLDYRISRMWAVGLELRQHMLFTDTSNYPSFSQALCRFEYVWGW